jgi:hypothetical protein
MMKKEKTESCLCLPETVLLLFNQVLAIFKETRTFKEA